MKALTILGFGAAVLGASVAVAGACDHGGRHEAMRAAVQASFTQADADGNGSLTADEFTAFQEAMRAQMAAHRFQRADTNGDGVVTLDELTQSMGRRHHGGPGL
jgi:EF-hand domain pair